ncbi:hypothetical protein [Sinomonas sp. RB5]
MQLEDFPVGAQAQQQARRPHGTGRYGTHGEQLPDGTSLLRRVVFDPVQAAALDADRVVAAWAHSHRRLARAVDWVGRGLVLVLGLALGWSVLSGRAELVLAAAAAAALFVAPDLLARLGRALRARREAALSRLAMAAHFNHHAAPWLAALSPAERARCYRSLLLRGEALLLGVRAQLVRAEGGAAHLVVTTLPALGAALRPARP